jgi:signal transduction histidine kinase
MWSVILCVTLGLAAAVYARPGALGDRNLLYWAVVVATVELLPVPARPGLQLSLSFPILLALAILYDPPVAALVALLASFDLRELRGQISFRVAAFNRTQIALSVFAGSSVFHALATPSSPPQILIAAVSLATAADYAVNVAMVATYMRLVGRLPIIEVLKTLRVGALTEFLLSYLGLGFVGLVIIRLHSAIGFWSVLAFILPLVFARQMFFRSLALEEASSELKDREQVLRALSNRMAEERQDERVQIAGYLHDDLAQMLFRLSLQVEMAKKRLGQGDLSGVENDLESIRETKQQTSHMVRALIRDLHRSPIGRKGLAEAIRSFAHDMSQGLPTRVTADVIEVSLPPPIQLLIYQIAREAVTNALKHAEAQNIRITLSETEDGVRLAIADDGKGFDTTAPPPEGHFGTVMMKERALVAGGAFSVQSEPGEGTTIVADFPRVWVEEGTRLESAVGQGDPSRGGRSLPRPPPVGSTTGPLVSPNGRAVTGERDAVEASRRETDRSRPSPRRDPAESPQADAGESPRPAAGESAEVNGAESSQAEASKAARTDPRPVSPSRPRVV